MKTREQSKEYRHEYNQRPEIKARHREYNRLRYHVLNKSARTFRKRTPRKEVLEWLKQRDRFTHKEFVEKFKDSVGHYFPIWHKQRENWVKIYTGHPLSREWFYIRKKTLGARKSRENFSKLKQQELLYSLLFDYKDKIDDMNLLFADIKAEISEIKKMIEVKKNE